MFYHAEGVSFSSIFSKVNDYRFVLIHDLSVEKTNKRDVKVEKLADNWPTCFFKKSKSFLIPKTELTMAWWRRVSNQLLTTSRMA